MATVTAVDPDNPIITTTPNNPLYVDLSGVTGVTSTVTVSGSNGGDTVILGDLAGNVKTGGGNDLVDASGGGSTVTGGAGNDFFISGGSDGASRDAAAAAGGDGNKFVFKAGSGKDVIDNFDLTKDVIKLKNIDGIDSAKDVIKHAKQSGDNVVIKLGDGNKITLLNVDLKDLKKNPGDHFDVS